MNYLERRIKMKNSIIYTLTAQIDTIDLGRLGNQVRVLVETIQFLQVDRKVDRDEVYKLWLVDINKTENEKVFASYIHDLIQYGFIDKMNDNKQPVNQLSTAKKAVSKMSDEEKAELIAMLTA